MPSTIVKLTSSDARAWAHNQPVWLDETGEVARAVTRDEQHAIGRALERTRKTNASFRLELPLLPALALTNRRNGAMRSTSRRGALPAVRTQTNDVQRLDCAFEVTFIGAKRVVTVFHQNLRYATGREVLAARLLADHGECVLHGRNGKCIGVLRDPLIQDRPPVTGRRVQWSRNPADAAIAEERMMSDVSPVKRNPKRARHSGKPTYSPAQCPNDCRGRRGGQPWALAKGAVPPADDEHHPICKYAPAWAATLTPIETTEVLYDLELSKVARSALPTEVEEAARTESATGMRQVTVAGRVYAVLSAKDAKRAALEARGEDDAAIDAALDSGADIDLDGGDDEGSDLDEENGRELTATPAITDGPSSPSDRQNWPRHSEMTAADHKRRADITARDYLSRQPPPENTSA